MSKLPIETYKEDDKITKVVVEDVYKIINRIYESLDKLYNNCSEILESTNKQYTNEHGTFEGQLIVGTGVSKPCGEDEFDENIGNQISFKKAKLNANLKKSMLLYKIFKEIYSFNKTINMEHEKIQRWIDKDLDFIRHFNKDYMV